MSNQENVVDLDAIKAARNEVNGVSPTLRFNGVDFVLPIELPFAIAEAASGEVDDLVTALKALLGDQYEMFNGFNPTLLDINSLFEALPSLYGLGTLPN